MVSSETLLHNKVPLSNLRFYSNDKIGDVVFFLPEKQDELIKFMNSQNRSYYNHITIPNIINNFLGKRLSSQKYYLKIKKELPNLQITRIPPKSKIVDERTQIFDFGGIINDILSISYSRSPRKTFEALLKLIEQVSLDYSEDRKKIIFIRGNIDNLKLLDFLEYIDKLYGGKIKTNIDGIIYEINNKYFPLAISHVTKDKKELKILRQYIKLIKSFKEGFDKGEIKNIEQVSDQTTSEAEANEIKQQIINLSNTKSNAKDNLNDIKELVNRLKGDKYQGDFHQKIQTLFDESEEKSPVLKIDDMVNEVNKNYNGTITVQLEESKLPFKAQEIVGLTELSGYDKQRQELLNNIDDLIQDLVHSTLGNDPELDITIKNIRTKTVDNYKDRYREYIVRVQHKEGYNKPYNLTFKIPIPVQGKYIKLGGNNFIMINQLFAKPIQKIAPNLVRFYTHFSTASLTLKNTKLTASNSFVDVEETFIQQLKAFKGSVVKLSTFDNKTKDDLVSKYDIQDLEVFKYLFIKVLIKGNRFDIDFNNHIILDESGDKIPVLRFYERYKGNELIEYAYLTEDSNQITFKNKDGDKNYIDKININTFIFNLYNTLHEELFGTSIINKSKSSKPFYSMRILGTNIPLAIFLLVSKEYKKAFHIMELKYQFNDRKDNDAYINLAFMTPQGDRKYLSLYPTTLQEKYYANGLNTFKLKDSIFEPTLIGLHQAIIDILIQKQGAGFTKNLLSMEYKFIDGSTFKLLQETGHSTTLVNVFTKEMVNLLNKRNVKSQYDLDNYRLRMSETITSVMYSQIHQALGKFKSRKHLSEEKIDIPRDYIIKNLLAAGILQQTKTLNPIEEMMLSLKVTKTGIGNVLKNQVTLNRRDINSTYFGILSPTATNEYGGIGVNQTLTNGAKIDDRFGSLSKKPFNNLSNSFENLSPIESLSPFFEYDDTTRRVMGNQQTAQFVQLDNPDVSLTQTGFESYVPHLVSDRFVKKSKVNGKIIKMNKEKIVIQDKLGNLDTISISPVKARTKRGIFLNNKYYPQVQEGQTIKRGQILATTSSLKNNKLATGKNLVVAEMGYLGLNYEDGWVVSDKLNDKYSNSVLQKLTIIVPTNAKILNINLESGKKTETGEELIKFATDIDLMNLDDDTQEDSALVGLVQEGKTKKYFSPGGIISEVVVKLNTKKVSNQILALYRKSTQTINDRLKECEKISKDKGLSKSELQEAVVNCIDHVENIESLNIGGHKFNQEEIDGAIIEVYIEKKNRVMNGSKFTLAASGGKGTVQYIMEHGKEPIAVETNLEIEFIATPLSIISRKNPSILLLMYLGKVIYFLNKAVVELSKSKKVNSIKKLVLEVFSHLDKTEDNMLIEQLNSFFNLKNEDIVKYINKSDPLNNPAFPAIVPPFKNKIQIRDIENAANILNIPLNEKVLVRENNDIVTTREVPVGIIMVNMLEHFPEGMSSVRGSINTSLNPITGQGRSGTKEGKGAIKIGEYDIRSLMSKRPYGLVKELHAIKSDALKAKKMMINTIIRTNEIPDSLDIDVQKDDLTSLNTVDALFKGAGLQKL